MQERVAIILVNYKDYAKKYLEEAWQSLMLQNYPKDKYNIYIVDNASSDKTFSYLKNNYSTAKVLKREDGNYSAANNLGAQQAIKDGCDYIVFCNMDTVFADSWLKELVKVANNDKKTAIVQSKILLFDKNKDSNKVNTLGNNLHFLGFGLVTCYGKEDKNIENYNKPFTYASGCSLLIKKDVFQKIDGYNENFYMYHDDVELSLKARFLGYDIKLASKSVVFHKYEFNRSIRMLYYMERNRLLTLFTFYSCKTLLLVTPIFIITELGLLFYAFVNGWILTKLKSYKYFLSVQNIVTIVKERRRIKKLRKIKDSELFSVLVSKLYFGAKPSLAVKLLNPILIIYFKLIKKII